jgi:hypothetical protein
MKLKITKDGNNKYTLWSVGTSTFVMCSVQTSRALITSEILTDVLDEMRRYVGVNIERDILELDLGKGV